MDSIFEQRVLVTGGAGFIGSALIWELNRRGLDNILVVDSLGANERWKNLVGLRFHDYLEADQLLPQIQRGMHDDIGCVFHLGACSSTTETDCRYLIENNYQYTQHLARWALSRGMRFVYASSAATYGDGERGMDDHPSHLDALRPLNMYGYSKHLFDLYAMRMGWLDKIVGLKYFNIFGPNEYHKGDMRSVVMKGFEQISRSGKMQLFRSYDSRFADGGQQRDFCYVKDAVSATLHLASTPAAKGLFNIGSGTASTWIELIDPVFRALGLETKIEFIEMPEAMRSKYQYFTLANTSRLRATGWTQKPTSLSAAVEDYVANYLIPGRYLSEMPS